MTQILAAVFFLLALPVSCLGWGLLFRRLSGMTSGRPATTIALGVASVIYIGGWLNRLAVAYAPALLVVLAGGLLASFLVVRGQRTQKREGESGQWGRGAELLAAAFAAFLAFTQLPPWEYNHADDLQKYFTWPTRMLATGTMVFSSTSALGAESLGGQSFLHGLVLAVLPVNYLGGLDGIFGLGLCLLLALSASRYPVAQILGVLAVIVIHPQIVNISTLYVGVALIMGVFAVSRESGQDTSLPRGLIYAALLACKPTFAIFIAFDFVVTCAANGTVRLAVRTFLRTGGWCLFFLAPWLLLHCRHWLQGIGHPAPAVNGAHLDPAIGLFSTAPLFYGASMLAFSAVVFGTSVIGGLSTLGPPNNDRLPRISLLSAVLSLSVGYLVTFFIFGPLLTGQALIVRYFTPVLIALVAVIPGLSFACLHSSEKARAVVAIAFIPLLALFLPSFGARASQLLRLHHQLSYQAAGTGMFQQYNNSVLGGATREPLAKAQAAVPPGAPIFAWVDTAFQLNFTRNPIHEFETAGALNPWAAFPKTRFVVWDKKNLAASEQLYLMVNNPEYRSLFDEGYHERQIAARWLDFYRYVDRLTKEGRLIDQRGTIFIYELKDEIHKPRPF